MNLFSEMRHLLPQIDIQIDERLDIAEVKLSIPHKMLPTLDVLESICDSIPKRDKLAITLMSDSGDLLTLTNQQDNPFDYADFCDDMLSEDMIDVRFQLDKSVSSGLFSIYFYDKFETDLLQRPTLEIMRWFSKCLKGQDSLVFQVFDTDVSFSTRTIAFESNESAVFIPTVNRRQLLRACRDTASFYDMSTFELLPDDFAISGTVRASNRIQSIFGKIANVLAIVYVASYASIADNTLQLQFNGHRSATCKITLTDICEDEKWLNIYTWIYTDGNPTDKALIGCNVISLHCKFESFLKLDDAIFDAIKTNYNLYLRKSIGHYLDMKRDVAKFIQDVVAQVGEHALTVLGQFKRNLLAMFGFLFTVAITRIGTMQEWEDIFTRHTIYLVQLFVFGSLAYLVSCFCESRYKLKKTKKAYNALKENYSDVLSEAEIKEVFKDDELLRDAVNSTILSTSTWAIAWGVLLLVTVIAIELFTPYGGLVYWFVNSLL